MTENNSRTFYIYEITNIINNKTYIGQHVCPKDKLPDEDKSYMGSGVLLTKAKKKYGIENFTKEIIAICNSRKEADILETQYIKIYREIGKAEYNLAAGGKGSSGVKHSEEFRKRDSEMMKSLWTNEEYRNNMIEVHKGKISWARGKKFSDEYCLKLSESHKGFKVSDETKEKISIANKGKVIPEEQRGLISNALKGRHYYNNGVVEVKRYECPEGFILGRLPGTMTKLHTEGSHRKISQTLSGTHFWNNGTEQVLSKECPGEEFVLGKLKNGV